MFLQMLKFPIDYFSSDWFGYFQPIFSFLDLSYYQKYMSENAFQTMLIFVVSLITVYWMTLFALYLVKYKFGETTANVRRLALLLMSTVLYMPVLNTVLKYSFVYLVYSTAKNSPFSGRVSFKKTQS
jgi:hypothetical protein